MRSNTVHKELCGGTDVASGESYGQLSYQMSSYYSTDTGIFQLW